MCTLYILFIGGPYRDLFKVSCIVLRLLICLAAAGGRYRDADGDGARPGPDNKIIGLGF